MDEKLAKLIGATLGLPASAVSEETNMDTCAKWTSLQHFNLILTLESAYGVRFSSDRIPELTSVAALQQELQTLTK